MFVVRLMLMLILAISLYADSYSIKETGKRYYDITYQDDYIKFNGYVIVMNKDTFRVFIDSGTYKEPTGIIVNEHEKIIRNIEFYDLIIDYHYIKKAKSSRCDQNYEVVYKNELWSYYYKDLDHIVDDPDLWTIDEAFRAKYVYDILRIIKLKEESYRGK